MTTKTTAAKPLNKYVIARHIDRAIYTGTLPESVTAEAAELVAAIDAGKGGIPARAEALIAAAWMAAARTAAGAGKPVEQRRALAAIRAVGELETALGLAPVSDTAADTESDSTDEPESEPESESATATPTHAWAVS